MDLNWTKQFECIPYSGQEKQGYTLTYISHLQSLLLLGGNLTRSNQIYLYNLLTKSWAVQKVSTPKPTIRKFHTAYYQKMVKGLIIYGGQTDKKRSLDCFWILFIEEWKWRKLAFKSAVPSARQLHTFTPISNGNYLIFGGISLPYQTYLQDLWVLKGIDKLKDTKTLQIAGCSCSQITGKGQVPSGRYAHSAYYLKQTFYVIGGQSQKEESSFTIYSLNMRTMIWNSHNFNINLSQLMGTSLLPNPSNPSQIFILGGITSSNKVNNFVYSLTFKQPNSPTAKIQKRERQMGSVSNISLQLKKHGKVPFNQMSFDCVCQLPFNQVFGICCRCDDAKMDLYRIQLREHVEQLELEEYLKYIKNEQLLSQQLLTKVSNLESLYQQIQNFTSSLYKQYQQSEQYNAEVEKQKQNQIQACMQLKDQYAQIQNIYNKNLGQLAKARRQLAGINQYFQGCIETQRDQDQ